MKLHTPFWAGLFALSLIVMALAAVTFPALAKPSLQGRILPTPTPFPVEKVDYDLTTVGGTQETLTFEYPEQNGITPGESTVTSFYPRGMVFTLNPSSANGTIEDVILFLRYVHGSGTRVVAEYDEAQGLWVAHPWENGDGQPAWTHFDFSWRVRDSSGVSVDTEPIPLDYWDPTREWFRLETPYIIVYWFGFSEDNPDWFARSAAEAIAATQPRREEGFGRTLSYKSIAVIYGSRETMNEMYGSGISNPTAGGYTSNDLGVSVQFAPAEDDDEWNITWLRHVITHELVHLYQYDVLGGNAGPNWWTEGQADWFGITPGLYDERLMNLATMQDLPTLTEEVTRNTVQADGQLFLVYDMGASFINWLLSNYGGTDTHRQIVEHMQQGVLLWDAIERVVGKTFFDLQNEWRAYIGLPPFELSDLDPVAALEPPVDPVFDVGDTVTLPATPPLVPVYEAPGPNQAYIGQCFANMTVEVLHVGSLEGVDYYQVNCMGQIGWMTREQLVGVS